MERRVAACRWKFFLITWTDNAYCDVITVFAVYVSESDMLLFH